MGDNYCDSVNNRAFCNYDGGDCCQSTVKTKKVSGMLVPLNKPYSSDKEMMLDLVLVTLINSQCLFPNSGVTQSLGINSTSHMWAFFLFLAPNPLGFLYFLNAMHPVRVACCHYQALTFIGDNFYLHKVSILETTTEYTIKDFCILPLGTSLNRFFLLLPCVQPYVTARQITDSRSKRVGVFRLHQ